MTSIPTNESGAHREITREPGQSISTLPMLSDAERQQMLMDWNNTAVAYPEKNLCLHQLIEEQAARTPDQAAVVFEQQRLSYGELNHRAQQLAHHLRGQGIGPEMVVGLFVERSLEMMVGILGILKAGAAYLPIDAATPHERIAFMLSDAKVTVLLTQTSLRASLPPGAAQIICLDSFDCTGSTGPTQGDIRVLPENLAYVIYTSGSTGRPKGVCIEHRNIVNYVLGVAERLQLKPGMNHATVSTIAADLGNTVIFPALVTGGCLHIISQARAENQGMLSDYFNREKIDVLKIVPSHLAALQSGRNPEQVMPRSRLILGGEASRLDWIERLRTVSPSCEIYNHYGPTETTVGVITHHIEQQLSSTQSGTLPLGKPLPNSRIYILDEQGQAVPIGVQGELFIGGSGVARGYLNRQDLTAERFVPDPFGSDPDGRLYRTGDLARYLPDGNIEFCGRIDYQVKIHGYRIELGEIEGALREQGGVRDAVVLASEDESGSKQLVAYVVPKRVNQPLWGSKAIHVLPDGSAVAHLNRNETDYIYNEIFTLQAYLRHGITINDGDCLVDAGSNIGLFTVFASRLARNLRIISFEPNPAAFACLQANAEAWGTGVKCLPLGLSSENKSAELTFFEGLSLLSGFYADAEQEREVVKNYEFNKESESQNNEQLAAEISELIDSRLHAETVTAQLRTLSSVVAEEGIDRIDLLKINVEKSELDVLTGLSPEDWPKIRQLVIEVDQQKDLESITALLEQHGFEVLVEQDPLLRKTELCYVYAIRPSVNGPRLIQQQPADAHVRSLPSVDKEILTPATLRKYLKDRLPQYMIPSAFVLMEKFPLTSNGKIDRKALPTFSHENIPAARDFVRPHTEIEKELAAIWTELLQVENIGLNDDFFDLGGHSLMAIKAVSRIRDVFAVDLQTQTLFEYPTIAGLSKVLTEAKSTNGNIQRIEQRSNGQIKFEIRPFTEDLIPAVKEFNARLDAGGAPKEFRFPEHPVPEWLPEAGHRQIYQEYFVVVENSFVRGCYMLKHQPFSFYGTVRSIDFCHWPISEGIVDKKYAWVYSNIMNAVLKAQPLQYGLAMGDPVPEILAGLGWSLCLVPFQFKVNRPRVFFKEIRALRQTPAQRLMMDIVAATRIGGLGLKIVQASRSKWWMSDEHVEAIESFSGWADDLWNKCKDRYAMIAVRDSEALNILYPAGSRFLCYKVTQGGAVLGWAVLLDTAMRDNKHFGNLRVGSIVDCLAAPEDASVVMRAATKILEKMGVDLIVSNQSHSSWSTALRDAGFFQGPSNFNFGASGALTKLLDPLQTTFSQIHLTRGDGDGPTHL